MQTDSSVEQSRLYCNFGLINILLGNCQKIQCIIQRTLARVSWWSGMGRGREHRWGTHFASYKSQASKNKILNSTKDPFFLIKGICSITE